MKHLYLTRKVLSALFLLILAVGSAKAQFIFNPPKQDGVIKDGSNLFEYSSNARNLKVSGQGNGNSVTYRITWDANNLYIAAQGQSNDDRVVFYFDSNPIIPVNGGDDNDGSPNGYSSYDQIGGGLTAKLPFRADLVLAINSNNTEVRLADGGKWTDIVPEAVTGYGATSNVREVAIAWSAFPNGRPANFNYLAFATATGTARNIHAILPSDNESPTTLNNKGLSYYYTINGTDNGKVNIGPVGEPQGLFFSQKLYEECS
ncbi:hypothetical protein F1C16_12140 [Hymenobacter sp. NBH84]|uniref:hypothetical protein n=1 Tax=Hymenobacter sp. NBH84 TaxID=2596915 RepID=UPI0016298240|nr:hypothetical protein [Hymenobacter sp. NBH84]QNE40255.1 hypothetical protein F1C16_12140 [Hymenobacter sp. NBH84]